MNVKKFTAPTSREALRKVREALGPDAVILSNRAVDGIVEILALAGDDAASLAPHAADSPMSAPAPQMELPTSVEPSFAPALVAQPAAPVVRASARPAAAPAAPRAPARPAAPVAAPAPAPALDMDRISALVADAVAHAKANAAAEMSTMMSELRAMRGMMETQLNELAFSNTAQREPHKTAVMRELLAAGFSASLARYLADKLPAARDAAEALQWARTALARNINAMNNEDALLEKGGVFALVGPTGVGKTTTTAKLAARCVMRHGPEKLALITTDAYRIGAHEQLRIYGKILGVMVHSVKDEADLRIALNELKNKHTVLIDTVGVSQRDQMVAEQVAMLQGVGSHVQRILCMNATSTQETLSEVVRAYQGSGLAGAIITKLDEAASIGSALDVVIRHKLRLFYASNGQRVPEDLHLADPAALVERALGGQSAAKFGDAELPLLMAGAAHDPMLREVRFG
ncbi:flagellar biosynthesis protein FlhF [Pseudoduganella sp. DS3]|uniref:Flagellar biosynthesis protein FlhF n=1 Tax=Pseudoduganella guangdongensis TaxID=2692179 RepID=A0A6N9HF04_9BURK|nr:flagellar biosynthesis protein FlhF [Pseudoduganella guangdongensis]MYN01847.1 flagellar biosynthesis protein FlhF [Pseudoduganella guangdongensis]